LQEHVLLLLCYPIREEKFVQSIPILSFLPAVRLVRKIVEALQAAPRHVLPEEHFEQFLELHFGKEEAQAQLETAINWGRYAELFTFQEERGMFRLEEEGEPAAK